MLHRAYALSSTIEVFNVESSKLRSIFSRLDYPMGLTDSAISNFVSRNASAGTVAESDTDDSSIIRKRLPFKGQVAANAVRK